MNKGLFAPIASSLLLLLASLSPLPALAQSQAATPARPGGDIAVTLSAQKIVATPNGAEATEIAEAAKPGDVLEYRAEYRNVGLAPTRGVEATLPIPLGTEYLPTSAKPNAGLRASVDGKTYQSVPLTVKVRSADGTLVDKPVPAADYRYLRWNVGALNAQQAAAVSARVRVQIDESAAPKPAAKP